MSNKRNAVEMGADVEDTTEIKKQCIGSENLVFFFFTAASCGDLCQGCDLCHPEECEPEEANAISKKGTIYKQVGHGFDLTFASLTCLFIRMREDFVSCSCMFVFGELFLCVPSLFGSCRPSVGSCSRCVLHFRVLLHIRN